MQKGKDVGRRMVDRKLNTMRRRRRSRALDDQVLARRLRLIRVNSQQSYEVQGSTRFTTPVTRKGGDRGADAVLLQEKEEKKERTAKTRATFSHLRSGSRKEINNAISFARIFLCTIKILRRYSFASDLHN